MTRTLAVAAVCAALSCGGDNPADIEKSLAGTWSMTSLQYKSDSGTPKEMMTGTASGTLTLALEGHTFALHFTDATGDAIDYSGTWVLDGIDLLQLTPNPQTIWGFDLALSGDALHLTGAQTMVDINDDGAPEHVEWAMHLKR